MDILTIEIIKEKVRDSVIEYTEFRRETTVIVRRADVVNVCRVLKEDARLQYNFLSDLCGVDWLGKKTPRFEVVYNLYSLAFYKRIRVKVQVDEGEEVPSLTSLWKGANWFEREAFDMYGILFSKHPDLTRILMPDDWEGHPLRKDYPAFAKELAGPYDKDVTTY